jgi:hypothetical protein
LLTALSINEIKPESWYKKLYCEIRGNTARTEILSAGGVLLRHITVDRRRAFIDWEQLDTIIGAQRNHLICSDSIILPKELGYKRFDDSYYRGLLSLNLSLNVVSKLKNKKEPAFAMYDPNAEFAEYIEEFAPYCGDVTVICDYPEKYADAVRDTADTTGAVIMISGDRNRLADADLICAPTQIREPLPLGSGAVVLTSVPPTVCISAQVYFDYRFRMPNTFAGLKPGELSEVYFCAALYTKARQYELASIVPTACFNYHSTRTVRSLCEFILENSCEC